MRYGEPLAGDHVGFHASHEQAPPSALLATVRHAEQVGFDTAMCSDHLAPWSERQRHSGHASKVLPELAS